VYWIHQARDMNTWGGVCARVRVCGEHGTEITASIQGGEFIKQMSNH